MRVARRCTVGLLLLVTADLLSPAPGAFSWESPTLFVDAVVRVTAQREAVAVPAFVAPARPSIEADASSQSGTSVPVTRGKSVRGTLRPHIKRDQSALVPQSPSEDH